MQTEEVDITSNPPVEIKFQDITDSAGLKNYVIHTGERVLTEALEEGRTLYDEVAEIDKLTKEDALRIRLIRSHFIGKQTKHLGLLFRDILFETQKAELLVLEARISEAQLAELIKQSLITIAEAKEVYEKAMSDESLHALDADLLLKQDHPWPVYEKQLLGIREHLTKLKDNEQVLNRFSNLIIKVKEAISDQLMEIRSRFEDLVTQSENIIKSGSSSNIEEAMDLLIGTNQSLDQSGKISGAHKLIENTIMEMPVNISAIIDIKGGLLIEEDLSPQYQLDQWYDIEILPHMDDAYQQIDSMTYNLRLALINITNRLELLQNKAKEFSFENHLQPLHQFVEEIPRYRNVVDTAMGQATEKINLNLSLRPLLSEEIPFLSLGFQSSINRFKKEQNLLFERANYFWSLIREKYFSIKSTVQEESKLGDTEKVIRYIQGAGPDRKNVHYNNFFNAKVTMVEAFWMGREIEQKRIGHVMKAWSEGYHGSILLHGDRFSGKSSLGGWISQQYFRGKTYELHPNSTINISNTKVELSTDLIAGIKAFIERVQYAKPMIWIDDLELWLNEDHPADEVGKGLTELMNTYGKRVCFVVSMGSWTFRRWQQFFDYDQSFQSTIELSSFTKEVLKEAILLRHGASHKSLIGADGQPLKKIEFDRYVSQIARQSNGNIGHALQLWVNGVRFKDEQHVEIGEIVKYKFPDIITGDNGILLSTLLVNRRLYENELSNRLGPAYDRRYRSEVASLVGYGVIRKAYNGQLSINDKVVPAITKALRKHRFV